ncbi:FAD binding domain protein [Fonsecaea pedrosoi]|nr:FAD binding domain protein [Fonsecaea pedrosoi]
MIAQKPPLKVIVVGAGFAGLATGIECAQRGMDVTILEKYTDSNSQGDILDFFPNGGRVIKRWANGAVGAKIHETGCNKIRAMELYKYDGKYIVDVPWARTEEEFDVTYAGHRGKLHSIIAEYARSQVKDVRVGVGVVEYLEETDRAGVRLSTGETLWGDCVIAADGPRSIARKQVLGITDVKDGTSWAVFRSFFKTDEAARKHPDLQNFFYEDKDTVRFWMWEHLSLMAFQWNGGKDVAWVLIHPEQDNSDESWSNIAKKEEVIEWMKPFTGKDARALLDITPLHKTIDFKLVYRPAIPKWTSEGGRTILIGDAAHANLPTAGQGASQALEDAVTVAHCLAEADGDVRLGLEAAQRIRYHRSNAVHKSGQMNRDAFRNIPWDEIEANPEEWAKKRFPKLKPWDPQVWAEENFPKVAEEIRAGKTGPLDEVAVPLPEGGIWSIAT